MAKTTETRYRNWTLIVYPESAPKDWRQQVDDLHIQWVESPLHDKDVTEDGEKKKPHRHVLLLFDGVKSFAAVKEIADSINAPKPEVCQSAKSMVRYFAHKDNPEKYQYDEDQIKGHGGVELAKYLKASTGEIRTTIQEIITFLRTNDITEVKYLIDFIIDDRKDNWFDWLFSHNAYLIDGYIRSQRSLQSASKERNDTSGKIQK